MPFEGQLLAACWALLEMEALPGPEPVTLCTQLPIISLVMKATSHKLSMTIQALIWDGDKPGPAGVSHLKEEGFTCPQSLARSYSAEVLLLDLWLPWDRFSITKWTTKGVTCFIADNATSIILWISTSELSTDNSLKSCCFSSFKQDIPENGPKNQYNGPNSRQSLSIGECPGQQMTPRTLYRLLFIATSSSLVQPMAIIKHSKLPPRGWRTLPQRSPVSSPCKISCC